jgi:hypothetical protein
MLSTQKLFLNLLINHEFFNVSVKIFACALIENQLKFLYKYTNNFFLLDVIMNNSHPNGVIQLVE